MKCKICGKEENPDNYICRDSLIKEQLCLYCHFWQERYNYDQSHSKEGVVIDGIHYYIGDESSKSHSRGFGGAKFQIQFNDGEIVNTTNLWCQGEIPPEWKDKFPNNAKFIYQIKIFDMTPKDAIFLARKYNLEHEVRQELASGATPEEALEEWDIV